MPYHLAIPHQYNNYFIIHNLSFFVKNFFIFFKIYFKKYSERAGIRTPDNLIKSQVLYHLSYTPLNWGSWTRTSGAGVRILCLTTWRYPINATARLYYHMFPTTVNTFFEFFLNLFFKSEFFQILTVPETVRYWLPIFKYDLPLIPLF